MNDCTRFDELVVDYLEGDLSGADLEFTEDHMEECSKCAESVAAFRGILSGYRGTQDDDVGPATAEGLRAAARVELPAGRRGGRRIPLLVAAAAAIMLFAWVGLDAGTSVADHLTAAERFRLAGDLTAARTEYERALELGDGGSEAARVLHLLGTVHAELGELVEARARLTELADSHSNYPHRRSGLVLRAEVFERLGESELALDAYRAVAREFGDEEASRRAGELATDAERFEDLRALGYVESDG